MNVQPALERSAKKTGRKPQISLATLLGVLALCCVLLAWYVDHRRLAAQVPPQPKMRAVTYRLNHASPELAAEKLNDLYPPDFIDANLIGFDANSNSVIVLAESHVQAQIQMVLRHIDREGTEFVVAKFAPNTGDEHIASTEDE